MAQSATPLTLLSAHFFGTTASGFILPRVSGNIALFSWEYLYILLALNVEETASLSLKDLWNQSEIISQTVTVDKREQCFLPEQNERIIKIINSSPKSFNEYFNYFRSNLNIRGVREIEHWEQEKIRLANLTKKQAIAELLKAMKLDEKITTIKKFLQTLDKKSLC